MPRFPVPMPLGFSIAGIRLLFIMELEKAMNSIKEKKMKKIFDLSLCALLIFGLAISTAETVEVKGTPGKHQEKESSEIREYRISVLRANLFKGSIFAILSDIAWDSNQALLKDALVSPSLALII